jgi:hypothetical protein
MFRRAVMAYFTMGSYLARADGQLHLLLIGMHAARDSDVLRDMSDWRTVSATRVGAMPSALKGRSLVLLLLAVYCIG